MTVPRTAIALLFNVEPLFPITYGDRLIDFDRLNNTDHQHSMVRTRACSTSAFGLQECAMRRNMDPLLVASIQQIGCRSLSSWRTPTSMPNWYTHCSPDESSSRGTSTPVSPQALSFARKVFSHIIHTLCDQTLESSHAIQWVSSLMSLYLLLWSHSAQSSPKLLHPSRSLRVDGGTKPPTKPFGGLVSVHASTSKILSTSIIGSKWPTPGTSLTSLLVERPS
jgi:hypothetical protein